MTQTMTSPWPEGCQGAISLTFDDGRQSQLDIAIPLLDDYDLKGTFYLPFGSDDWQERLAPWHEVALSGHEIGNHTVSHPCSRNFSFSDDPKKVLETMTLADIEADIVEASRRLHLLVPEQEDCTFCYPCYQDYVGEGRTRQSYVPIVAQHFPAARGRGERANHPFLTDLHYLYSWPDDGMPGAKLIGLTESAVTQGRWGIFTFHNVHRDDPFTPTPAFRRLCAFLVKHQDRIWVAPVVTVAHRIIEWRKEQV